MATVHSLDTAKDVVSEAGEDQIDSVYSYTNNISGKKMYAVFFKGSPIDIHTSIYCKNQKCLFEHGKWLE